ncbi:MAG: Verru_Chthon cassette protein A [Chthoniobacteraceae bacterium]
MKRGLYPQHSQKGIALFIVLAVLVLISVLVIAFFSSITTEVNSARSYANGATVKQLADSAVQLVVAQVADGTSGTSANSGTVAWASQPGMIRTYNTSGTLDTFYKLYSANLPLAVSGTTVNPAVDTPPVGWNDPSNPSVYQQYQGLYTDLNSPVTHDGNTYFPIIDGNGITTLTLSGSQVLTYSTSGTSADIEGFSVDPTKVSYSSSKALSGSNNPVSMPVKWLYVLQDGKIASPTSSSNGIVTFDPAYPVPSTSNAIVGRVAFWTDDETCKVNVNTASEGTFWDRPWANTTTEQNFATAIPAQNEFQRYPGHPAKNCLSTVFGAVLPSPSPAWYYGISPATQTTNTNELAAYYDLIPRVADGGTKGGNINEAIGSGATSSANPAFQPITMDGDRLYASTDELLYSPALVSGTRQTNSTLLQAITGTAAPLNNTFLQKTKFFLTAHSSAPELNLFGKPRMTLWPLQMDTTQRNAKDKLLAFCSTIGGLPYYFQRYSTYTSPGTLGAGSPNSSSQSATLDWTGVSRNQSLYSYITQMTQQNIPGFGGNFSAKYPNSDNQIVTEMFDMIRSGVNGYSNGLPPSYNYAPTYLDSGEGQIVPLIPPAGTPGAGTHGFGRFVTVTGATIVFYRSNPALYNLNASTNVIPTNPALQTILNPSGIVLTTGAQIGAVLILNPFTAAPGFPPWSPNVTYKVTGLNQFTINSATLGTPTSLGFGSTLTNTTTARSEYSGGANCTPFFNVVPAFRYGGPAAGTDSCKTAGTSDPIKQYSFIVPISPATGVQLGVNDTIFDFNTDSPTGHAITITVYAGSDIAQTTPIQTIQMNFPAVKDLLVPTTNPDPASAPAHFNYLYLNRFLESAGSSLSKPDRLRMVFYNWLNGSAPSTLAAPIGTGSNGNPVTYYVEDIARSVEADGFSGPSTNPAQGDYRVFSALSNVPASYFAPTPGYDAANPPDSAPTGGYQPYTNAQTLKDQGTDGGGGGGFGCDNSVPGGYYPHFGTSAGGSINTKAQVLAPSVATGILIPQSQLAQYGGTSGWGSNTGDNEYRAPARPAVPPGLGLPTSSGSASINNLYPGDWDNLTGLMEDGPFINKPDEGNSSTASNTSNLENLSVYYGGTVDITGGYFSTGWGDYMAESGQTFSPNRQIASAVMFGSLPTGIDPSGGTAPKPWRTLLFCANPPAGTNHPGFGTPTSGPPYTIPPDHLMLDLFTMPVVEPYAISEPLSTAGKINMNYQIAPFTYITRDTGVRAVLKSTRIMAIPQSTSTVTSSGGSSYKDGQRCKYEMRYNINPDEIVGTLAGFQARFTSGDIFRCASEICGIYLVPQLIPTLSTGVVYPPGSTPPASYAATAAWWNNFMLTGDNTREMPYGDIYARLTTKSNTYTVHMRVQTLKKIPGTQAGQWVEGRDQITGEYRGSQTIERYIDTNDTTLPDFALSSSPSAEGYYKIRLLNSTTFTP